MREIPGRIVKPDDLTSIHFGCKLSPEYLQGWLATPQWIREFWGGSAKIFPCEETGETGTACLNCRYVDVLDVKHD